MHMGRAAAGRAVDRVPAAAKVDGNMLLRERDEEQVELRVSLSQLKKLYVALFRQLHDSELSAFEALDEDDMLMTLQTYLQRKAREAGVDGTIHSEWEAFLGISDASACSRRDRDHHPDE